MRREPWLPLMSTGLVNKWKKWRGKKRKTNIEGRRLIIISRAVVGRVHKPPRIRQGNLHLTINTCINLERKQTLIFSFWFKSISALPLLNALHIRLIIHYVPHPWALSLESVTSQALPPRLFLSQEILIRL